ncbi:MAG TPA: hypothetical protein VLM89_09095 [Phycisphaerae bacterium]|nr:hypothetical protein [Phycisphaerae bacterium]
MAGRPRTALGELAYHVMNRVAGRQELFEDADDYAAFEWVLAEVREARERGGVRVYAQARRATEEGERGGIKGF